MYVFSEYLHCQKVLLYIFLTVVQILLLCFTKSEKLKYISKICEKINPPFLFCFERLSELGIQSIMSSIGVEMDNVLAKFSRDKGSFDSMAATMRRRAQRSREMQETVAKLLNELLGTVGDKVEVDIPARDPQKQQMYNDLQDTFKAFDRDNNAYLVFTKYQEAWRFLNLPGDQNAVKSAFNNVDVTYCFFL